jgi:hypothetical protein
VASTPSGTTVGTVELPRAYVDTTLPVQTGRTWAVAAGGNLQGALDLHNPAT